MPADVAGPSSTRRSSTSTSDHTMIADKEPPTAVTTAGPTPAQSVHHVERGASDADWETDPANPRNWSSTQKWICTGIVGLYTFVPPLASSMMAPALPSIPERYGVTDPTIIALTLVIFLLSFAIAPLFLAPLSEMYGRTWVYHIGNMFSLAFNLGCAFSPNVTSLIVFRFLSGFSGATPIAIGGGTVSDLFSERDRASAMAVYSLIPLIGPAVGPVAGGFITQSIGIRYIFIIISGICLIAGVLGFFFLRETYAPIIRERMLKKEGDPEKAQDIEAKTLQQRSGATSKAQFIWVNLSRPVVLLTRSLICFMLSLYMAFLYGLYYLMFATFGDLFGRTYGFSIGVGGLVYLGLGIGFLLATIFGARFADGVYKSLAAKNGGKATPEMRIPALIFGSLFCPIGLFWYGWSAQAKLHWMMPIVGSGIFGFGMMTSYLPIQLYLVDSFTFAASVVSAASVFRSLLGFAFPLFADKMFDALGVGGGNSLLGGLAILLGVPFPVWLYYRGEQLRMSSKYTRK